MTTKELLKYIEPYNEKYYEILLTDKEDKAEGKHAIEKILTGMMEMPDSIYTMKGSFFLNNYEKEESELFYINDMVNFAKLIDQKMYYSFLHELYDFLRYKVMKDGKRNAGCDYLPLNVKNALIEVLQRME